ncbi:MAG TPA: hypothetical protein DIS53_00035 [Candidatus Wildermuthbacteria bacterium]|uniref:Uncharacterized protein n=1 Tax=Candidatus Yanofskybacteria bacterium GW2011_GWC1_48_11 TaxID=1619027 RepID=A0A837IN80_9BACT|nr:MAG: hypothetical protein UY25_C0007G0008 [Candidatus Yanofskybacteria bacterium GW2011_GWC1_48_11]KKW03534.1 MAG: hypothetical protein UY38_C0003G0008 [Parcubacteria group bacterium GW2011_GWB1_49_12]KKW08343.1 MAG: hypothetical protein UY45_C0008G0008 [Parcubacteria group bacterium GW2011_GWA1_49_26]KKW13554.1 MAG: hypothetical protein UY53_C0011G0019 [Parcubacteria group bacterium GW2011_GWA2_50_10]OHA65790.1 MAG: hypothetical protein A2674_03420 [Candidatus Wildermuthbacteria bacterium R
MMFLVLILTAVLLAAGVGLTGIIVAELRALRGFGDSVFAFGAADAGAERGLYVDRVHCNAIEPTATGDVFDCVTANLPPGPETLPNNSEYELESKPATASDCPGYYYCIESKGRFQRNVASPEAVRNVQTDR